MIVMFDRISDAAPYVLALGDSLTAGYGLAADQSFAARLQLLLRDDIPGAVVCNAGVSGDTSADALRRLPRLLTGLDRKPDLAIVELGANDVIRGLAPEHIRTNLDTIIDQILQCRIAVLLASMEAPAFLGASAARYNGIYADLAAKHNVASVPFFPPGILGHRAMVLADRLHPNARAVELIARAILPAVKSALARSVAEAAA
jgi:acyl-CoA thioesterase-1